MSSVQKLEETVAVIERVVPLGTRINLWLPDGLEIGFHVVMDLDNELMLIYARNEEGIARAVKESLKERSLGDYTLLKRYWS